MIAVQPYEMNANTSESDDSDKRYFLQPESVSRHLYCSVCQEVFVEPQRAPCGHSFCKKCIFAWLRQSKTCPEDRRRLHEKDIHHDFILENIIGDQMVACPFRRNGCVHVGQLALLASHKRNCCFDPANMPEFLRSSEKEVAEKSLDNSVTDAELRLPTPAKPSLKMRLFQAGGAQRELLCSAFEGNENKQDIKRLKRLYKDN